MMKIQIKDIRDTTKVDKWQLRLLIHRLMVGMGAVAVWLVVCNNWVVRMVVSVIICLILCQIKEISIQNPRNR